MRFRKTGGGCMLIGHDGKECDAVYESVGGDIRFIVYTSVEGFRYLPQEFECQEDQPNVVLDLVEGITLDQIQAASQENL